MLPKKSKFDRSKLERSQARLLNNRGLSLLEMMVATAVTSMVVLGSATLLEKSKKMENKDMLLFWISTSRIEIQNILKSQSDWQITQNINPSMQCLSTANTSCAAFVDPQPLRIQIASDPPAAPLILDGATSTWGIGRNGGYCNQFDAVNGNASCPIGIRLSWKVICDNPQCEHAQPQMDVQFQIKEPGQPLENLRSFDLRVYKDPRLETLSEVCTAMGGTLNGSQCENIAPLNSTCDPANSSFPIGFNADGIVICGNPNPGTCANGWVATGFAASGEILCTPACQ